MVPPGSRPPSCAKMALLPGLELLWWPEVALLAELVLLRLQAMVWCLAARSSHQGLKQHGAGTMAGGSNRDCSSGCPSFLHRAESGLSRSSPLHLAARVSRQGLKQQGVVATTCCSCEPPRAQAAWRGRYCLLLVRSR